MTEPTDAEIVAVMRDGYNCRYNDEQDHIDFARAVLAKWGTPPAVVGEPFCYVSVNKQGDITRTMKRKDKWTNIPLYTTPQPTQAQAGAVPMTRERLQEISLDYSDSEDECTGFRDGWRAAEKHHGIKGGQHGESV